MNAFSVDGTLWSNVGNLFRWMGREEKHQTNTGGLCILGATQIALKEDYGINVHVDDMKSAIIKEVERNADHYKHFHSGSVSKVIISAFEYLKYRTFTANVVDLVIPCAADALGVNFYIYTRNGVNINLLPYMCKAGSEIDIYLKYDRHGGNKHGADHYNPVILLPGMYKNVAQSTTLLTVMTTDTINTSHGGCHPTASSSVPSAQFSLSDLVTSATQERLEREQENNGDEDMWAIPTSFASLFPPTNSFSISRTAQAPIQQFLLPSDGPVRNNNCTINNASVTNSTHLSFSGVSSAPRLSSQITNSNNQHLGLPSSITNISQPISSPFGSRSASSFQTTSFSQPRQSPSISEPRQSPSVSQLHQSPASELRQSPASELRQSPSIASATVSSRASSLSIITPFTSAIPAHREHFGEASSSQPTNSQQSASDETNDEAIVNDIISGCIDDEKEFFFDEMGSTLVNTSSKLPPVERPEVPNCTTSEAIMSFADFAGPERDPFFLPSKEDSDVEVEPTDQGDRLIDEENEEITEIPEKYQIEGRPKGMKWSRTKIDFGKFTNVDVEMVDRVPWDVDGNRRYVIFCEPNEWHDKQKDGRWYKMNSTKRIGFEHGRRKIGKCQGSRICHNVHCPKLQTEGVCNTSPGGFYPENGLHVCRSCGYYATQIFCGCIKVTEYDPIKKELSVVYEGEHICTPKPDLITKRNFFEQLPVRRNLRLAPQEVRNDAMRYYFATGQWEKGFEVALHMKNPELIEKLRFVIPGDRLVNFPDDEAILFSNISDIKEEADKWDKFLIYKINCSKTNGGTSFVFKTSKHHLETAVKMDASQRPLRGKISILAYEKAYFDGMHRRVRGYKTLTLWLHHPGMRRMKRLASMDVKHENKESVQLFFETFNEALREYTGDPNYYFNPAMFVTDAAGAIHQGMYSVFGDPFIDKISTCQWHFKRCAWRQLVHIQEDDRASFREAVHGVCNAKTAHEYELYASMLDKICSRNKVVRWWNWWKVRRYHLVPALRGFGWTGTNWAEPGQSKLKKNRRIGLIDAVLEDIIHALNEYVEWLAFVDNTGKTTGKGSTLLKRRLKERKDLRAYAQSIIDALQQGNLLPDMVKHRDPAKYFIANCAAKHRVPRTYPLNNPTQEDVPKHTQKGPGRGKSSTRGVHGSITGRGGKGRGFISAASLPTNDDEIGNDAAAVRDDILVGIQDVEEATGEQLLRNDTSAPTQVNTTSRSGRGRRGGHVIRCGRGSAGGRGSRNGVKDETSAVRDATKGRQRRRGAMQTGYEPRRNPERERRGYNPRYRGDDYSTDEECHAV